MHESTVDSRAKTAVPYLDFLVKLSLTGFISMWKIISSPIFNGCNANAKIKDQNFVCVAILEHVY